MALESHTALHQLAVIALSEEDLFLLLELLGSLQARPYMVEIFPKNWIKKWLQNEWQHLELFVFSGFFFPPLFLKLKYESY